MATTTATDFEIDTGQQSPGRNLPQKVGGLLWAPMWLMAIMAFPAAWILGIVRANAVSTGTDAQAIAALGHVVPAVMFIGFAAVFAAISFAIARILGEFRAGGGELQEATGRAVHTLKLPGTAKAFIALMAMAMMILMVAIGLHFVVAASIAGGNTTMLSNSEQWAVSLEAVRRIGVALYLFAIMLGLVTILRVIRFQATRMLQLPQEARLER